MSRFERWTLAISAFSTLVTIAGFGFVWMQLRSANDSLRTGVYANMSNWTFELDKAFIEHPELRPYFYDKKDIREDDPLFAKAAAMAEFELDNFDSIMEQERYFPAGSLHEGWRRWIFNGFDKSPVLVRTIEQLRSEYEGGPGWEMYQEWKTSRAKSKDIPLIPSRK